MRKTIFQKSILLLNAFSIIFLSYGRILACQCDIPTICQAYTRAESVFVGKLIKIEEDEESNVKAFVTHFEVEKSFKGDTGQIEIIKFVIGSCERRFFVGEKYFVYKEPPDRMNRICNMTNTLPNSGADLEYARDLSQTNPIFMIGGKISGLSKNELKKVKLFIEQGRRNYKIPIDALGFYDFTLKEQTNLLVKISIPFEAEMRSNFLGGISFSSSGDKVEYSLEFKPNECDYREIQIQKTETTKVSKE